MDIWFSLATRAATKAAVFLWYHEDIRRLTDSSLQYMTKRVIAKLERLPLSKPLQQQVASVVGPIGKRINIWIEDHNGKLDHMDLSKVLCWKSLGTIDYKKTAEKVIRSGIVDTVNTFRMACGNCIEDQLIKLWPICGYDKICTTHVEDFKLLNRTERQEVSFWISYLTDNIVDWMERTSGSGFDTYVSNDRFEYGFEMAVNLNNEEFSRYYLNRMQEPDRTDILELALHILLDKKCMRFNSDLLYLVISELSYEKTQLAFEEYSDRVLCLLLEWPLLGLFSEVADRVRDSITEGGFFSVLLTLSGRYLNYVRNKVYECIFEAFWMTGTVARRDYVLSEWIYDKFLNHVFSIGSMERFRRLSNFEENLYSSMLNNGLLVLEVLTASCFLDMLETIIENYMREDLSVVNIQYAVGEMRITHECGLLCHPNRFEHDLILLQLVEEDAW